MHNTKDRHWDMMVGSLVWSLIYLEMDLRERLDLRHRWERFQALFYRDPHSWAALNSRVEKITSSIHKT